MSKKVSPFATSKKYNMLKYLKKISISRAVLIVSISGLLLTVLLLESNTCNLADFVGPPPGYKNVYSFGDPDGLYVLLGKEIKNGELIVSEITYPPQHVVEEVPEIPARAERIQKLYIRDNSLIQNLYGHESILIKKSFGWFARWNPYGTTMIANDDGTYTGKMLPLKCSVDSVEKGQILSQPGERDIITVKCESSSNGIFISRYASGIGLIESSIVYPPGNTALPGMQLLRIEKSLDP